MSSPRRSPPLQLRVGEAVNDEEQLLALLERSREPWVGGDVDSIIDRSIGTGFGYRSSAARGPWAERTDGRGRLQAWYDSLEYIRLIPGDTNVFVDEDVAIVYGSFTEEFCHKGSVPRSVTVRFSNTAARRDGEWVFVWAHRDATPFDGAGRYIPASTS